MSAVSRFRRVSTALLALPVLFFYSLATTQAQPAPAGSVAFANEVEGSLVRTLETLKEGSLQKALREIDLALQKQPNFRLGHLIKGDLLMARSGSPQAFNAPLAPPEQIASLRSEAKARLTRYFDGPPPGHLPTALLQIAPQQTHALLMDSEKSRLYLFRNIDGAPQLVADFYASVGKKGVEKEKQGDQRTPLGVYTINSAVDKKRLSDLYGVGAYELSFPNEWDKRLGRTGYGIWLHGTPSDTYSRPPLASDGCVVITNDDFSKLSQYLQPGITPIIIAAHVRWKSPDQWLDDRSSFESAIERWKRDWESLDQERYLNHYSKQFSADGKDYAAWVAHKRRVNASKSFVKVEISGLSAFEYSLTSQTPPMMIVTFEQTYKSSNNASHMTKRQYWQREADGWKILYEAQAS